jgi:hypothetical protein
MDSAGAVGTLPLSDFFMVEMKAAVEPVFKVVPAHCV